MPTSATELVDGSVAGSAVPRPSSLLSPKFNMRTGGALPCGVGYRGHGSAPLRAEANDRKGSTGAVRSGRERSMVSTDPRMASPGVSGPSPRGIGVTRMHRLRTFPVSRWNGK